MSRNKKKKNQKAEIRQTNSKTWIWGGLFLMIFTFILFSPSLKYDFVNWDDDVFVYENEDVKNFNTKSFFTTQVNGNYSPLTLLTFAAEYKIAGENAFLFHLNNILLHVLNTLLVFLLIRRLGLSFPVSFLVALLFGIHPMRIESVVWITERKDVLFSAFFLLSLIFYTTYLKTKKSPYFILSLFIYVLSLLSKIQAVALAPSVLLIDYWFSRKLNRKLILEKIPFFLLALATGLTGIWFLKQGIGLDAAGTYPFHQRIFIGSYSFVTYLIKSVVPWKLSAYYSYPQKISAVYYLSIIPALAVVLLPVFKFKTNKTLTFGILFFLFNVFFVLQIVGAGQGFMADRFTYIPYIGLFLIYAKAFESLIGKYHRQKLLFGFILAVYFITITTVTFNHSKVWKNSETLWTDVIDKYPEAVLPYNNLGHYRLTINQPEKALENYNTVISLAPNMARPYISRGKIYFDRGEFDKSIADYSKSIELEPNNINALTNRAAAYGMKQEWETALSDLNKALELEPSHTNALSNRAFLWFQTGEYEKSIEDFNKYLLANPGNAEAVNTVGLCHFRLKNHSKALEEFNRAISIDPGKGIYHMNRSLVLNALGDKENALIGAQKAKELGANINEDYINYLKQ